MGTSNDFYIRASESSVVAAVRALYPAAYTEPGARFFVVKLPLDHYYCPESELQLLTERLKTDVIWLSFQSCVDAFQYHHWNKGKHLRSLVYGCFEREREWERVDGNAQPWESDILFGDCTHVLEGLDNADERREIVRLYREKILEVGAREPRLSSRETARGVASHYRLPGWS